MEEQGEGHERARRELQAQLADEREALLAVVSGVDEQSLTWPTRNPDWAVRDVLAHVLASDADLISLLEAAGRPYTTPLRGGSLEQHEQEMARWADATPQAFAQKLRERGDRWRELLAALPDTAFAILLDVYWGGGVRKLLDVIGDWRGHYPPHAEDVRLALADGRAGALTQHVRIALAARDLDRAIRFYEKLTGLSEPERIGNVWARLQLDSAELWLMAVAAPLANSGAVGLEVRGRLEDVLPMVQELGGEVLSPIEDELTTRVVRVRDPEGNLISLLQPAVTEILLRATDRAIAELEPAVAETPEELLSRRPDAKQWSVIENLAHVLQVDYRAVEDMLRLEDDPEAFKAQWHVEAEGGDEERQTVEVPPGATAPGILGEIKESWGRIRPRLPKLDPALAGHRVPVGYLPTGYTNTVAERLFALFPNHASRHIDQIRETVAALAR